MRSEKQIFKLQRPVVSSESVRDSKLPPLLLIYNKDQSIQSQVRMTEETAKLFVADEYRIYFEGHYDTKTKEITVDEIVGVQDW